MATKKKAAKKKAKALTSCNEFAVNLGGRFTVMMRPWQAGWSDAVMLAWT